MPDVQIKLTDNGPYVVSGPVTLLDSHGNALETFGPRLFLCRCGASSDKPFCDGTHSKIGFSTRAAPAKE